MEERTKLFSKDTLKNGLPLESETDLLLKKMERMRKVKNNYKNIDVLDNIYNTESVAKSDTKSTGFFDGIQRFFKNIDDIHTELAEIEGFDNDSQEGFDDDSQEGFDNDSQEGFDDDSQEGFDNNELYSKQYEDKYTPNDVIKPANINTANLIRRPDGVRYYGPRGSLTNPSDNNIFKKMGKWFKGRMQKDRARENRINRRGREKRDRINRRRREQKERIRRRRREKQARIRRRRREQKERIRRRHRDSRNNRKKSVDSSQLLERLKRLITRILGFNPQRFIRDKIATRVYKYTAGTGPKNDRDIDTITKQIILLIYAFIAVFVSGN